MSDNSESTNGDAPTLKKLNKDTIRRISSDQVVTDLVTALKELIENALDAGATQIQIKLWGHGLTQFTVRDNGSGITCPDLAIAGRRYYTSKLGVFRHDAHDTQQQPPALSADSSLDEPVVDLATAMATSYGFRGEALASLIDLADSVAIASRARDSASEGWCVQWDHSNKTQLLLEQPHVTLRPQAQPQGTTVTVRGLFNPTPVRRKVLEAAVEKSAEHKRVVTMLYSYCLIRPLLKLHLAWIEPSTRYDLNKNPQSTIGEVILAVFGPETYDNVLHVTADEVWQAHCSHVTDPGTRIQFQLEAYIPRPDADIEVVSKSSPDRIFLFMNGRPVEGTQFGKELTRHFRRQFDQRRKWPFAVVSLTLPVDYFDVNLSPNKRAVLIRDEETLTSYWRSYLTAIYPVPASPLKSAQQTYFNTPVKAPLAQAAINQGSHIDDDDFVASPAKPTTPANIDQLPGFQSAAELHRANKRAREPSDGDEEPAAKRAKTNDETRPVEEIECVEDTARPQLIVSGNDWLNCHVLGQIPQSRGLWVVAVKQCLVVCDATRLQQSVYYQRLISHHKLAPRIELKQPVLITTEEIERSDDSFDERLLAACLKLLHSPDEDDEHILVLNGIQLYAEDDQVAIVALAEEVQPMSVRDLVPLLKLMVQRKSVSEEARKRMPVPRLPSTAKRFKELAEQKVKEDQTHKIELTREQVKELIVELCDPDTPATSMEAVLTPDNRIVFYALTSLSHDP